ncbi:MAG TPA: DUF2723 domain-containing protein, partial [Nitrospirota bacterium]|nr:DUF2723 domain-containing protein [Nitrospirota bacterium]
MRITGENRVPPYGALLFLGSFALYLVTLAPGVTFWDSGELIAASHALGIPHQPGYPLYCLIGKASSFVPFGAVAYRYNLLSALLSALAVYVVYLALAEIITRCEPSPPGPLPAPTLPSPAGGEGKRKGPHVGEGREHMSLAAVFAAALAPVRIFWSQAVVAEVYAANALIIASLVLAYARALSGSLSPRRYFALSGLLFGLGVISHASLVLYLPALVLGWALLPHPQGSRLKSALVGMFFIGLGLSVYLYLPVRAAALPAVNLGHPDTLARFVSVVKWGQYLRSEIFFLKAAGGLGLAAGLGWKAWAGAVAALAFAAWLIRRSPRLFLPLFAFAAFYGAAVHLQMRDPGSAARFGLGGKFYMPLVVVFIISAGFAAADLMRSLGNKAARVLLIG